MRDESIEFPDLTDYRLYPSLSKRFYRELAIEQYLEKKISIQVDLGLDDYLEENQTKLAADYPQATEEQLKAIAKKLLFNEKLSAHIEELKSRANLVILRDLFR